MDQIFNVDITVDDKQTNHVIQASSWVSAASSLTQAALADIPTDKPVQVTTLVEGNRISIVALRLV